jgi:hypothetical protein
MPTPGLEEIIESAVEDVILPDEPDFRTAEEPTEVVEEAPSTPVEATTESAQATPAEQVDTPATRDTEPVQDDFEKRFGIPQNSVTGRENRIPYSRVKKITEKAEKDTDAKVRAEYVPKLTEFETKVKTYEEKLSGYEAQLKDVRTFEEVMTKSPEQFLGMLVQMPQYQRILAPLFQQEQVQPQAPVQAVDPAADMPQPDQKLSDGTSVYSMDGLAKLNAWNRAQAAKEARETTLAEVEKKFGPIYNEWEQHQRVQQVLPKVQAQIESARKWPQFNENEPDIVKALQADRSLSLEAAYRQVVLPKIQQVGQSAQADRAQLEKDIRAQVLKELKQVPRGTSAQAGTTKPSDKVFVPTSDGDDKLTSIIRASIRG